jgi:MFS family permease
MSVLIVLFAVFAMTAANATVYATLGPFGRSAGLSEVQVGAIFAASGLLFVLTSSAWGRVADRRGRRPVIVTGLGCTALSLLLFAALFSLPAGAVGALGLFAAILAARVLYGLTAGGIQPAATAHAVAATGVPSTGAALVGAAVGLGSVAGPILSAALVAMGPWLPLGLTGALAMVAAAIAQARIIEQRPASRPAVRARKRKHSLSRSSSAVTFLLYLGLAALQPTTAFFIQDVFRIDTGLAVQRAAFMSVAFAASAFIVQALVVRRLPLSPRTLLSAGLGVSSLAIGSCLLLPDFQGLVGAFAVAGIGYGLAQPGLTAWALTTVGDDGQAEAAGQLQAAMSAAWVVGPLVGTTVYALDRGGALALAAGVMAAALLIALRRRGRPAGVPSGIRDRADARSGLADQARSTGPPPR